MTFAKMARAPGIVAVFFSLLFVVFTTVFPYMATLNNPNENVRVYMTMAVVEQHTFRIDSILERHGYVNDMARAPDPKNPAESHLYSIKAPAVSYLAVPVYWLWTKVGPRVGYPVPTRFSPPEEKAAWFMASVVLFRLCVLQIPIFLFLVGYERFLRAVSSDVALRLITVAAVGVGTNFLAYTLMFVSHSFFGMAAFTSFAITTRERALVHDARRRRPWAAFFAGSFAGLATLAEYQAFPVSVVLSLYALIVFYRPTRLAAFALGGSICAAALMFYQWACYGNAFTPGHKMAENAQFAAWHQSGFFGLSAPSWDTFRQLSFSHAFGFFGMSPFMWLGLLAIPFGLVLGRGTRDERRRRRLASLFWILAMLALFVPISGAVNWRGGWTLGPRFFGAAPPFFGYGALVALEHLAQRRPWQRALARGVAGGLALAGVVQLGFVALVFNTYPESVTRPLPQVALPLARLGFVPHHAGELVGWRSPAFWYFVVACLAIAALLAALWPVSDRVGTYALRLGAMGAMFYMGLAPAFSAPEPDEGGDGAGDLRFFAAQWEPKGRDRIAQLRETAERHGPRGPCLWYQLADMERMVHWDAEAARDEKRANVPRSECP
ncbi:hypothetical protein [Pendulispora albinea]|uniref:Glycosyltransferase RgtA/B/C/D-like domain-containing protein n=1 Tax=Pendulispora albinea TaxID=2741071 RepID=A0ABZ2LZB4_9BACT